MSIIVFNIKFSIYLRNKICLLFIFSLTKIISINGSDILIKSKNVSPIETSNSIAYEDIGLKEFQLSLKKIEPFRNYLFLKI